MPFCPKCWEQYPKDFVECTVCKIPLTEEKPDKSGHEHHHEEKPQEPAKSKKKK